MHKSDRTKRMMTEIGCGVPKEESFAITDEEDAAMWDRLKDQKDAIKTAGVMIVYDIDWPDDRHPASVHRKDALRQNERGPVGRWNRPPVL